MQEFILYVKENIMDNCEIDLKELFLQYRGEAQEVKHHRRFADTVAIIRLYHYVLMQFLVDEQLITEQESSDRAEFVHQEMTKMIEQQNDMVLGEDPAELFMRAISEMILSNEMIPLTANKPEHSLASKSVVFKEKDYYYFIPTTTYAKVIDFYRRRDKNFVTSERATWNALKGKDILELAPQNDGHADYKILKRIGNRNARVIVIKKSIVESY
jgi:hypothetical protein